MKIKKDKRCKSCGSKSGVDLHHLMLRSQGGTDDDWNVIALCRSCHGLLHDAGLNDFTDTRPGFALALQDKGWYYDSTVAVPKWRWKHSEQIKIIQGDRYQLPTD